MNLQATETIVANVVFGLLLIATTPWLFNAILSVGVPDGRTQAVQLGFCIGLAASGFILLAMAYEGYRGR